MIEPVARAYGLAFIPLSAEQFDFLIPHDRWARPAVVALRECLASLSVRHRLARAGFQVDQEGP